MSHHQNAEQYHNVMIANKLFTMSKPKCCGNNSLLKEFPHVGVINIL
jgi:hypothetical protein